MRRVLIFALLVFLLAPVRLLTAQESSTSGSRKLLDKTEPLYPTLARKNGLTGTVKLRVVVAPDGKPKDVAVVGGNPVFVESATDSVKKWKWSVAQSESTEMVEVKFSSGGSSGF